REDHGLRLRLPHPRRPRRRRAARRPRRGARRRPRHRGRRDGRRRVAGPDRGRRALAATLRSADAGGARTLASRQRPDDPARRGNGGCRGAPRRSRSLARPRARRARAERRSMRRRGRGPRRSTGAARRARTPTRRMTDRQRALLVAIAAAGGHLRLGPRAQGVLFWSLVVTAWGNEIASVIGPLLGGRGLEFGGGVTNSVMYVLFMIAVVTVLVAMAVVLWGALRKASEA